MRELKKKIGSLAIFKLYQSRNYLKIDYCCLAQKDGLILAKIMNNIDQYVQRRANLNN